MESWLATIVF